MFVEAWDAPSGSPIRLSVSQIVVYNNQGTPLLVAAEYGIDGAQCIAKVGDDDFERVLKSVGFGHHKIIVDELNMSPVPSGAKLINP